MDKKERELIVAEMRNVAQLPGDTGLLRMARLFGDVYDKELPINSVTEAVSNVVRAEVGEDVDYLVPEDVSEALFTISADCTITQTKVSPSSDQELTLTDVISDERYTCIHDWLKGKHNVLKLHTDAIMENMNRREEYSVLQLISAGATASGNVFTLDSGKEKFDFPKLVEMRKALKRYGRKLVLITGANVTEDIELMDYDSDKNREHPITKFVDTWIPVDEYNVKLNGSDTDVIDANVAYLVAVSDSKEKKPILFARRKTAELTDSPDTESAEKERIIIVGGNAINVASDKKLSKSVIGFGEYGGVLLNNSVVAKFTRS